MITNYLYGIVLYTAYTFTKLLTSAPTDYIVYLLLRERIVFHDNSIKLAAMLRFSAHALSGD